MTEIRPAPKHLAMLAQESRGWPYTDSDHQFYDALVACHEAGWSWERILRESVRLLLDPDATPGDLRLAARDPRRPGRKLAVVADPEEQARATAYSRAQADKARALLGVGRDEEPEGGKTA